MQITHDLPDAPSDKPEILEQQLSHELKSLGEGGSTTSFRPYLLGIVGLGWEAAKQGSSLELKELCYVLDRVKRALPTVGNASTIIAPEAAADLEIKCAIRYLSVGVQRLIHTQVRERPLSRMEAKVLRVLKDASEPLQRKEVHSKLNGTVTPARVGQILADLFQRDFLVREQFLVQGGNTSFYALAEAGRNALAEAERSGAQTRGPVPISTTRFSNVPRHNKGWAKQKP